MYTTAKADNIFSVTAMHTGFTATYPSNYIFSGEFHNFWEVVLVLDGRLGITAGSNIHILEKGQAVIHEPMEFHSLWSEGGTSPTVVIFSFDCINMPCYSSKILQFPNTHHPLEILNQLHSSFRIMHSANFLDIKKQDSIKHHLAIKAFELFLLNLINTDAGSDSILQTRSAQYFSKAVTILEENISKNLSVSEISVLTNIGIVNLKKIFSKYSGMGVIAYFTKMKTTAAISMLKSGMNVNEVSSALGFSNQNYFSTVFKRTTGYPPSHYK